MLIGDFNGDGIQDVIAIDFSYIETDAEREEYAQKQILFAENAKFLELSALRVNFGDGVSELSLTPTPEWDLLFLVGRANYSGRTQDGIDPEPVLAFAGENSALFGKGLFDITFNHRVELEILTGSAGVSGFGIDWRSGATARYYDAGVYERAGVYELSSAGGNGLIRGERYWYIDSEWVQFGANDLVGSVFDDVIDGNGAKQELYGLGGNDVINAGGNRDTVFGGGGDDIIDGGSGKDTIYGGDGDDFIYGNKDNDIMYGDDGDDTFQAGDGDDEFYGGEGYDFVDFSSFNPQRGVKISLESDEGSDIYGRSPKNFDLTFDSIEAIKGSRGDDRIQGKNGVEQTLDGHDGNDRLFGADQPDILIDGAGRDNMHGRGGADTFVLVADDDRDTISDFEVGVDQIDISAWGASNFAALELEFNGKKEGRVTVTFDDEALVIKTDDLASDITADDFIF